MKIIKQGKLPTTEKKKSCSYCKTKFVYDIKDVSFDRDGSYVVCPNCNKFLNI
jgi:uncharacterized Zn-finger protein